MAEFKYEIKGIEGLKKALADPEFIKGPAKEFLEKASALVERSAKEKVPVDTGRLRQSIASEIQTTKARIGSNLTYAPFVEFGTRPHFPPLAAMQPWAVRHGFPTGRQGAFLVARAISIHGTKPRPYLFPALEENKSEIEGLLKELAAEVERRWGKGG